ncbi:DUF523 domain-containing protein [Siccibacter turicensis]|uniref:DUF523 domain-containing protein n=1 Tax=Siccibacter turicensis TaxID=357233 RepID=UPI00046626E1|nr:DUF523 domain-containing protein [Siccibacter turicensis]
MNTKILVSACLMGHAVRYNASSKTLLSDSLVRWRDEGRLVVHCPELAAGLTTPRLPAEIVGRDGDAVLDGNAAIVESDGRDVTPHYQLAAWLALDAARSAGCRFALLTDGSPTCGSETIYNGQFIGQRKPGSGVASALLRRHGIEVFSEAQIDLLQARLNEEEQ